jgi:hypothetical protein
MIVRLPVAVRKSPFTALPGHLLTVTRFRVRHFIRIGGGELDLGDPKGHAGHLIAQIAGLASFEKRIYGLLPDVKRVRR